MTPRPWRTRFDLRRFLILATTAATVVACGNPGTSSTTVVPSPSIDATSSPVALVTSPPTAPPTPAPTPGATPNLACPSLASVSAQPLFVNVTPDPGRANIELQVTAVEAVWDPSTRITPEPRVIDPDATGVLLGGRESAIWPAYFVGSEGPMAMVGATVTLTPTGQPSRNLPVRIVPGNENFDQIAFTVPDIDGVARLDLELRWLDGCFRFTAEASQTVSVAPLALTRDCQLDQDHWADGLDDLFGPPLTVAGTAQDLWPSEFSARYTSDGSDGDPPDPAHVWKQKPGTVKAASAGVLEISAANLDLELSAIDAELYRRADFLLLANDTATESVRPLWNHDLGEADDGWTLAVDADPGRYVLILRFDFASTCLTGTATSVFSLEVD